MNLFEISGIILLIFVCIYGLVDRICSCLEQRFVAKTYQKYIEKGGEIGKMEEHFTANSEYIDDGK